MKKLIVGFAMVLAAGAAQARSGYLTDFNGLYGTANTKLDSCVTCHGDSKSARNSYGAAFEARLGSGSVAALTAIEGLDSDGDGSTNIVEINALTYPGDASDKPGSTPPPPPPPPTCADADADGFAICDGVCVPASGDQCGDCNDAAAAVNPGVTEICTDGVDNNCDGKTDAQDPVCAPVGLSDFDLLAVRPGRVVAGRKATVKVDVALVVPGPATLNVQATEGGITTDLGSATLSAGGTFSFVYYAKTAGAVVTWSATIVDQDPDADVLTATSAVR